MATDDHAFSLIRDRLIGIEGQLRALQGTVSKVLVEAQRTNGRISDLEEENEAKEEAAKARRIGREVYVAGLFLLIGSVVGALIHG